MKTSWRRMAKTNILVLIKRSWVLLKDVFWRRMIKGNIFVLMKTSWRRLQDFFWRPRRKTSSSRWKFAGKKAAAAVSWLQKTLGANVSFVVNSSAKNILPLICKCNFQNWNYLSSSADILFLCNHTFAIYEIRIFLIYYRRLICWHLSRFDD